MAESPQTPKSPLIHVLIVLLPPPTTLDNTPRLSGCALKRVYSTDELFDPTVISVDTMSTFFGRQITRGLSDGMDSQFIDSVLVYYTGAGEATL